MVPDGSPPLCPTGLSRKMGMKERRRGQKYVMAQSADWFPHYADNVLWVSANFPIPYFGFPIIVRELLTLLFSGEWSLIWIKNSTPRETVTHHNHRQPAP